MSSDVFLQLTITRESLKAINTLTNGDLSLLEPYILIDGNIMKIDHGFMTNMKPGYLIDGNIPVSCCIGFKGHLFTYIETMKQIIKEADDKVSGVLLSTKLFLKTAYKTNLFSKDLMTAQHQVNLSAIRAYCVIIFLIENTTTYHNNSNILTKQLKKVNSDYGRLLASYNQLKALCPRDVIKQHYSKTPDALKIAMATEVDVINTKAKPS